METPVRFFDKLESLEEGKKPKFYIPDIPFEKLKKIDTGYSNLNHTYQRYMKEMLLSAAEGNYEKFLFSPKNKYFQSNKKFEENLKKENISLDDWLNKSTVKKFKLSDKDKEVYTISKAVRDPFKDIFLGDEVETCISPDYTNFHRILNYLMDFKRQNIVIKDSKNNSIVYSRLYSDFTKNGLQTELITTEKKNSDFNNVNFQKALYEYCREEFPNMKMC